MFKIDREEAKLYFLGLLGIAALVIGLCGCGVLPALQQPGTTQGYDLLARRPFTRVKHTPHPLLCLCDGHPLVLHERPLTPVSGSSPRRSR